MYLSKNKKIVLFLSIGSITISLAIFVPILVINQKNKNDESNQKNKNDESNQENKNDESNQNKNQIFNSATINNNNIIGGEFTSFIEDDFRNLWAMGKNSKLQVLKVNEKGDDYVGSWTDDNSSSGEKLLKGSNVKDGDAGFILKDTFGNLWVMGSEKKLQVLVKNNNGYANSWTDDNDTGLLKGSKIEDGTNGIIFEDKSGNIWAMAKGSKLQVLVKNKDGNFANSWISDEKSDGLLKGSNIEDGEYGKIFEDYFGNLWSIGYESELQVLKKGATQWISDSSSELLLKDSNLEGSSTTFFQDKFKNLWAMGPDSKLQVLKVNAQKDGYVDTGWINNNSSIGDNLLKNSNITNGEGGTIFQDSFGNLWAMGSGSKLQVLKINENGDGYVDSGWNNNSAIPARNNLLKGSIIHSGWNGTIFQDSFGNLWAMGNRIDQKIDVRLHVLKINENGDDYVDTGWTYDIANEELLKKSNITTGYGGTIFEDSSKFLWSIGFDSKLQVYDKKHKRWIS